MLGDILQLHTELTNCSEVKLKSKRLPLETKNVQKNENQRLSLFICNNVKCEAAYAQLAQASVVLDFPSNQNGFNYPKGNNSIICTVMRYGKT